MTHEQIKVGAIVYGDDLDVDSILEQVARPLAVAGFRIEGFLQRETGVRSDTCANTTLESIRDGGASIISQNLGRHSTGCRLDPQALAELCGPLIALLGDETDLLVINRFGKGEALGGGFRGAIEHAVQLGIPVLTAVRETYLPEWEAFTEGHYDALPAQPEAILTWLAPMLKTAERQSRAA